MARFPVQRSEPAGAPALEVFMQELNKWMQFSILSALILFAELFG